MVTVAVVKYTQPVKRVILMLLVRYKQVKFLRLLHQKKVNLLLQLSVLLELKWNK